MPSVYWDADGIITVDYIQKGQNINVILLLRQLRENIKLKRRGKISKSVMFHQDSVLAYNLLLPWMSSTTVALH